MSKLGQTLNRESSSEGTAQNSILSVVLQMYKCDKTYSFN